MIQKKIAFIYYPHGANAARLETMSFALNSVLALGKLGWSVDIFLWEKPAFNYKNLFSDTVTIRYSRDPKRNPLNGLRPFWLKLMFQSQKNYYCVFGLGQIGVYIANIIAKLNDCPFIYLNDEFPSCWTGKRWAQWARLERQSVKDAAMILVPDAQRFHPLCQELGISSKPYAVLPNIPIIQTPFAEIDWHEELGVSKDCLLFLHAGGIGNWSLIPELLSSVKYWPEKAVLVLHGRSREETKKYRQTVFHLEVPEKVIWNYESMSPEQLNSLVAYCTGNFALYLNTGPNIEYMGFSSGKIMRSLACGSPVIASDLSSLSFIKDYQLGALVKESNEIPNAVEEIMHNRAAYSKRCLEFCNTNVSFEKGWDKFCEQLKQIVDIDLRKPIN
jgi:glycosyltransferase involved in cell wall biosynthesis